MYAYGCLRSSLIGMVINNFYCKVSFLFMHSKNYPILGKDNFWNSTEGHNFTANIIYHISYMGLEEAFEV